MEPELLLLDEPMAGMNVEEKEDMCRFILDVNDEFGTTIALIEHDMGVVMDISDRVAVLDYGRKIADGPPAECAPTRRHRRLSGGGTVRPRRDAACILERRGIQTRFEQKPARLAADPHPRQHVRSSHEFFSKWSSAGC